MKQPKMTKELQRYVALARKEGLRVTGGVNGGGWLRTATACGYTGDGTRESLKLFLRDKFNNTVQVIQPYRQDVVDKAINALKAAHQQVQARFQRSPAPRPTEQSVQSFIQNHSKVDPTSDDFLKTFEWNAVRMMALKKHGYRCMCCGASPATGAVINVDHIKPRKFYPELALDVENLQVLCHPCNMGKGNWLQEDFRKAA